MKKKLKRFSTVAVSRLVRHLHSWRSRLRDNSPTAEDTASSPSLIFTESPSMAPMPPSKAFPFPRYFNCVAIRSKATAISPPLLSCTLTSSKMAFDNLSSMICVNEGDLVYFRRLGCASWESSKVLEIGAAIPCPVLYLSNGMVVPQSAVLLSLPNVERTHR